MKKEITLDMEPSTLDKKIDSLETCLSAFNTCNFN